MNDTMMIAMDIMTKTKTQYIQTYLLLEEEEEEEKMMAKIPFCSL
jgi:hypothetical protein